MKRAAVLTSVFLSLMHAHGVKAVDAKLSHPQKKAYVQPERRARPVIRVTNGAWGSAAPAQIETLLNTVADEVLAHFPGQQLDPIVVSHSRNGPVVLYQKGPENEYQVLLSANDERWAEYVYEFSHELFHILAGFEHHAPPKSSRHQWFEETLGEAVSLHTLKRFSLNETPAPPLQDWSAYVPALQAFTHRALSEPHRQLPRDVSFEQWFRQNGPALFSSPYLRKKNELMANMLLPFLEQNADWRALSYLNTDMPKDESGFYDFLVHWYRTTPQAHRAFVGRTMQVFRFKQPADSERLYAGDTADNAASGQRSVPLAPVAPRPQ